MSNDAITKNIDEILSRGIVEFIDPDGEFKKKLLAKASGEYSGDIVIKYGVDPTRPDIHLGHAVNFRKLRQFQELGCKVVFLVGDFTTAIGDPTGKSKVRPEIDQKEIEHNMKTYVDQVGKLLSTDPEVFSWIRNSDWFFNISDLLVPKSVTVSSKNSEGEVTGEVTFPPNSFMAKAIAFDQTRMQKTHLRKGEIIDVTLRGLLFTLRHITHSRLVSRDMFQERIANGDELYMNEMLYPVFQGVDSYAIAKLYGSCDLELGGSDQTFNMIMGRDVMKANGQAPQAVLAMELLEGTDGTEKMSKSLDNYIAITDTANDMFGKIMSVPDALITRYFTLCTYTPEEDIAEIEKELEKDETNPRDLKMRLAREVITMYHGEEAANKAEGAFVQTFQQGQIPEEMDEIECENGVLLMDIVLDRGLVKSKSEFRRLVGEGAVKRLGESEERIEDAEFQVSEGGVFKLGKRRFLRVTLQ